MKSSMADFFQFSSDIAKLIFLKGGLFIRLCLHSILKGGLCIRLCLRSILKGGLCIRLCLHSIFRFSSFPKILILKGTLMQV